MVYAILNRCYWRWFYFSAGPRAYSTVGKWIYIYTHTYIYILLNNYHWWLKCQHDVASLIRTREECAVYGTDKWFWKTRTVGIVSPMSEVRTTTTTIIALIFLCMCFFFFILYESLVPVQCTGVFLCRKKYRK